MGEREEQGRRENRKLFENEGILPLQGSVYANFSRWCLQNSKLQEEAACNAESKRGKIKNGDFLKIQNDMPDSMELPVPITARATHVYFILMLSSVNAVDGA